jgi:Zn-dependent M16 (insulinase) family peptidase
MARAEDIGGFPLQARYLDASGRPVGIRLEHKASGMPVWVLRTETVPQAFFWWKTLVDSDQGLPHSLEHLLVGKGTKGRLTELLTSMRLGGHGAATAGTETYYHFYSSGMASFQEQLAQTLDAILKPDFSDLEAEREFFHVAVEDDGKGGLRLIEKGTVYNEMSSNPGIHRYWNALMRKALGEGHPLSFASGGAPEAMRGVTPAMIREYHRKFYALGPDAGVVLVIPPEEKLEPALEKVRAELDRFAPKERRETVKLPEPRPESSRKIELFPYPAKSGTDPANISFAWKPDPALSRARRMLHELLFDAFADGSRSNLYAALVDSKTRLLDTGATSVSHYSETEHDAKRPVHIVSIGGIRGNRVDEKLLERLREVISAKMKEIAEYKEGSPELEDLNRRVRSAVRSWKRDLRVFVASPPGFGFRETGAGWQHFLEATDEQGGSDRKLDLSPQWAEVEAFLAGKGNVWKAIIDEGGYLEDPYGTAGIPSPEALAKAEKEKEERLKQKVEKIGDLKSFSDQELQRSRQVAELESQVAKPTFMKDPPLTYDEQAKVMRIKVGGRPAMAVAFEGTPFQDAVLAFSLKGLPARYYAYLPFLPQAIRSVGLREGDKVTDYRAFSEEVQREVYGLSASFSYNQWSDRFEFVVQGEGTDPAEAKKALELMSRMLASNDLSVANLSRLRDLIDERISADDQYTKQWEEHWIRNPAMAFRWQEQGLLLATASRFTQAHFYHRLKWRFHDKVAEERIRQLEGELRDAIAKGFAQGFEDTFAHPDELLSEALRFLKARKPSLPEATLKEDLSALASEIVADLRIGSERALAELRDLQAWVLSPSRLSLELLASHSELEALKAGAKGVVSQLKEGNAQVRVGKAPKSRPWILDRLKARYPDAAWGYPIYAGLVHPDSVNGNSVINAVSGGDRYADPDSALELLSGTLLGGPGPHSLFIKTWEAGLAYSSGIGTSREEGVISYYADRSPNLKSTLKFVADQTGRIPELKDPWLVDYSLAQVFRISREPLGFPERAMAMMDNLKDGRTPERVRRFSKALLSLRGRPDLLAGLTKKGAERVQSVLLASPNRGLKRKYRSVFFLIAPEKQLSELDAELKAPDRLLRLWQRDFWIDPEGREP